MEQASDEIDFEGAAIDFLVPRGKSTTGVVRFQAKFRSPVQMEIGHVFSFEVVDVVREVHERL